MGIAAFLGGATGPTLLSPCPALCVNKRFHGPRLDPPKRQRPRGPQDSRGGRPASRVPAAGAGWTDPQRPSGPREKPPPPPPPGRPSVPTAWPGAPFAAARPGGAWCFSEGAAAAWSFRPGSCAKDAGLGSPSARPAGDGDPGASPGGKPGTEAAAGARRPPGFEGASPASLGAPEAVAVAAVQARGLLRISPKRSLDNGLGAGDEDAPARRLRTVANASCARPRRCLCPLSSVSVCSRLRSTCPPPSRTSWRSLWRGPGETPVAPAPPALAPGPRCAIVGHLRLDQFGRCCCWRSCCCAQATPCAQLRAPWRGAPDPEHLGAIWALLVACCLLSFLFLGFSANATPPGPCTEVSGAKRAPPPPCCS